MATKKLQILDSLIKQAENANTLDGKHASDFLNTITLTTVFDENFNVLVTTDATIIPKDFATDYKDNAKYVFVPSSVTRVEAGAFYYCTNITDAFIDNIKGEVEMSYITIVNPHVTISPFPASTNLHYVKGSNTLQGLLSQINAKSDKFTTLSGYGITDAYTKTEVDSKLAAKADLVQSKNIFDFDTWAKCLQSLSKPVYRGSLDEIDFDKKSITFTATEAGAYTNGWANNPAEMNIAVKPNTVYTFSWKFSGSSKIQIFLFFNGKNTDETRISKISTTGSDYLTFTTSEDTSYITIRFDNRKLSTVSFFEIMLEEGDKKSLYLPYEVAEGVKELAQSTESAITKVDTALSGKLDNTTGSVAMDNIADGAVTEAKFADVLKLKKASFYRNVAEMKADTSLKSGMTAVVLGYYEPNDGGTAEYYIGDSGNLALKNGLRAQIVIKPQMNVECFGAKGDGVTDDSSAIEAASVYDTQLMFKNKTYLIVQSIYIGNSVNWIGNGTVIKLADSFNVNLDTRSAIRINGETVIEGINIEYKSQFTPNDGKSSVIILRITSGKNHVLKDVNIDITEKDGVAAEVGAVWYDFAKRIIVEETKEVVETFEISDINLYVSNCKISNLTTGHSTATPCLWGTGIFDNAVIEKSEFSRNHLGEAVNFWANKQPIKNILINDCVFNLTNNTISGAGGLNFGASYKYPTKFENINIRNTIFNAGEYFGNSCIGCATPGVEINIDRCKFIKDYPDNTVLPDDNNNKNYFKRLMLFQVSSDTDDSEKTSTVNISNCSIVNKKGTIHINDSYANSFNNDGSFKQYGVYTTKFNLSNSNISSFSHIFNASDIIFKNCKISIDNPNEAVRKTLYLKSDDRYFIKTEFENCNVNSNVRIKGDVYCRGSSFNDTTAFVTDTGDNIKLTDNKFIGLNISTSVDSTAESPVINEIIMKNNIIKVLNFKNNSTVTAVDNLGTLAASIIFTNNISNKTMLSNIIDGKNCVDFADGAVTSDKIANGAISEPKLESRLLSKLSYVTPQMYGAKGDGISDDTSAVQAALNTGQSVYIPKGIYKVGKLIISNGKGARIYGDGCGNTILKHNDAYISDDCVIQISDDSNCILSSFSIFGGGSGIIDDGTYTGTKYHGIIITNCSNNSENVIENIDIYKCLGDGLHLSNSAIGCRISNIHTYYNVGCGLYNEGYGNKVVNLDTHQNHSDGICIWAGGFNGTNIKSWGNLRDGINMDNMWSHIAAVVLYNVSVQQNGRHGLMMTNCESCVITGLQSLANNYKSKSKLNDGETLYSKTAGLLMVDGNHNNYIQGNITSSYAYWNSFEENSVRIAGKDNTNNIIDLTVNSSLMGPDMYEVCFKPLSYTDSDGNNHNLYNYNKLPEYSILRQTYSNPLNTIKINGEVVSDKTMTNVANNNIYSESFMKKSDGTTNVISVSSDISSGILSLTLSDYADLPAKTIDNITYDTGNIDVGKLAYRRGYSLPIIKGNANKVLYLRLTAKVSEYKAFGIIPLVHIMYKADDGTTKYAYLDISADYIKSNIIFNTDYITKNIALDLGDYVGKDITIYLRLCATKLSDKTISNVAIQDTATIDIKEFSYKLC